MSAKFFVKLTATDNTYIQCPAFGLLEVLEFGTTGGIIRANFSQETNGALGAAVHVANAEFEYTPQIASKGHAAVVDLHTRQNQPEPSDSYAHVIFNKESREVLFNCSSRRNAKEFCASHGLRIDCTTSHSDRKVAEVAVYPTISTKALALAYNLLSADRTSTNQQLCAKLEGAGLTKTQAWNYVSENRPHSSMAA